MEEFLGRDAPCEVVGNKLVPRVYLDSTATALMPRCVHDTVRRYLESSCANSHTQASLSGRATTAAIERSRELVGEFVGKAKDQTVIFVGQGTTAAMNRLAAAMYRTPGDRKIAVVTEMEHHSNILPWERAAGEENLRFVRTNDDGTLDLRHLQEILQTDGAKVRVVAVTAASNVTGICNPIHDIARMVHRAGAEIAVDAAQAAPHMPIQMHLENDPAGSIDYLALSGHKLYAPGSPGMLVARERIFPSGCVVGDVGGGTVQYVGAEGVQYVERACEREEGGTPNIPGIIAIGAAIKMIQRHGMDQIVAHEQALVRRTFLLLDKRPGVVLYGAPNARRVGVMSFNLTDSPHGLTAAILSDYAGVAVRNECFCAQPYVRRHLLSTCVTTGENGPCEIRVRERGMVRASFGMNTTTADVDAFARALEWARDNIGKLRGNYDEDRGTFRHKTFRPKMPFDLDADFG
jgi:selenocysteine lyase/cysteine desulfurase